MEARRGIQRHEPTTHQKERPRAVEIEKKTQQPAASLLALHTISRGQQQQQQSLVIGLIMPFGEPSSNSYGTHNSSRQQSLSEQQQQQQQSQPQQQYPLRSRPHTRSGSVTTTTTTASHSSSNNSRSSSPSDLLFRHPQSSFDEFPYPPYSELPFTSLKRRKHHSAASQFVKWAMRAVLASPILVLVVWSIGAMIFSKNVSHKVRTNNINNNHRINARSMRRVADTGRMMTMMRMPQQPQPQLYGMQPQPVMMAQQLQQLQQQQLQFQQLQEQFQQLPSPPQQQQQQPPPMGSQQTSFQMNPLMATSTQEENPPMIAPAAAASATQVLVVQPPQALQQAEGQAQQEEQEQQQQEQQQPQLQSPPAAGQAAPVLEPAMAESSPVAPVPLLGKSQPTTTTTTGTATVLYYDPRQTVTGPNGEVRLPALVYDAQGNPFNLANLATQNQAQILLEAPLLRLGQAAPAQTMEPPPEASMEQQQAPTRSLEATPPMLQMAAPDIKMWGESTSQDQSIIVSTVAIMALLVGALSARRLRSRNVLSACIENESLEDDVAYDAAYSTTTLNDGSSSYNTFGAGGWKGDLEKFDV